MSSLSVPTSGSRCTPCVLPRSLAQRRWAIAGLALLALWGLAGWAGPVLMAQMGVVPSAHGLTSAHAHGQPFVDARAWRGLPNALDVLSNLPFVLLGIWGLRLWRGVPAQQPARNALALFFTGLVVTGFGSAFYHWAPDATGLVVDRFGMGIAFAGALGLAAAERVGAAVAKPTMVLTLGLAALSALLPLTHDNPLPWVVLQFGGMGLIVWAALKKPLPQALGVSLAALIALYTLAKLLELGDAAVFQASGEWVSGHSLKHLAAALAAWPVIRTMRQNARATVAEMPQSIAPL